MERSADPSSVEIDLMYVLVMVDASEFSAPMPSGWVMTSSAAFFYRRIVPQDRRRTIAQTWRADRED